MPGDDYFRFSGVISGIDECFCRSPPRTLVFHWSSSERVSVFLRQHNTSRISKRGAHNAMLKMMRDTG